MNYDLINIRHDEIGRVMEKVGCADRIERIMQLMHWAQMRVLESIAKTDEEQIKREAALDRMVENAEALNLYDGRLK